jgi:twitching motility protein PilT
MPEYPRNPELDRLVADLNRGQDEGEPDIDAPFPAAKEVEPAEEPGTRPALLTPPRRLRVSADEPLETLLAEMVRREASDLHLLAGASPVLRKDGELAPLEAPAPGDEELRMLFAPHLGVATRRRLEREGATDFSLRLGDGDFGGWRFRVNLHHQRGRLAAAVRALPRRVPTLEELNLPSSLADLVTAPRGLVLVTGPAGAGKTTTQAALVDLLNRGRSLHILTIEDPIEYEHTSRCSVVEQLELGVDTPSFALALKAAMRQDPDVLLVGEMRDLETMAGALTAAETGHLVLATLHTNDVAHAVHRIVDVFDSGRQEQIRQQLAMVLHAIVSQQLVPRADGRGRVPAVEILRATYPVRHHIRKNQLQKIAHEISRGRAEGMISMEESLARRVREGLVTREEAEMRSLRPDELRSLLGDGERGSTRTR